MAKYSIEDTTLTNIADAIRTKTGSSSSIMVQDMASEISGIKGEPTLQTKTVTPSTSSQTITPDSGYGGLSQVIVNAMPTATQATPSITINSSGLITASATQSAGYVASGTKQATKQLTVQAAKTITPSTSSQTAVASGRYTTGAVTVAAIPDTYIQPSGTLEVTENGTHDVKNYASVNVNVAGSGGGGGSVGMCTVNITCASEIRDVAYSAISDTGAVERIEQHLDKEHVTTYSFQCVPNTLIHLALKGFDMAMLQQNIRQDISFNASGDYNYYYYWVTAEAGGTARLIMSSEMT